MMEVKQALVQIRAVLRTEESIEVPRTKKKQRGKYGMETWARKKRIKFIK